MSYNVCSGRLLLEGDSVWFDDDRDLSGTVQSKTDRRFSVQWDGGNLVWYPLHQMFIKIGSHQRIAS